MRVVMWDSIYMYKVCPHHAIDKGIYTFALNNAQVLQYF